MGPGCAFVDLDNDGRLDIVLVNSTTWPGQPGSKQARPAVYRNNGNGTFTDVTARAGIAAGAYGLGVTAADYDNDGWVDLYFTNLGPNRLYRNNGNGTFTDVTAKAGVGEAGFSASAAFFDYDKDGRLDLYVANYVQWAVGEGPVLHAGRQVEVLLHARVVQGTERDALPQPRQRRVRGRHQEGGPVRSRLQGARRRADRLRQRRPPRPVRQQRHAAQPALPQQGRRHLRGRRGSRGRGVQRGRRRAAGMGVDSADYDGSGRAEPCHRQLLERDDGALPERGDGAVHRRSARRRQSRRRAC